MGLFSPDPVIDQALLTKLVNQDGYARKRLAKEQTAILGFLEPDEQVRSIGSDASGTFGVAVVTDRRIFQVKRGRITGEMAHDQISGTRLGRMPNGEYLAMVDGGGFIGSLHFREQQEANAFVGAIDRWLVGGPIGPRDIPTLYPAFYERILRSAGKPLTPHNMVQIIDRCMRMVWGGGADAYFRQTGDDAAAARFKQQFAGGGHDPERVLYVVDDMVDFLWEWNPACHDSLRRLVLRIEEVLLKPDSFLFDCGDELPTWEPDWGEEAGDNR